MWFFLLVIYWLFLYSIYLIFISSLSFLVFSHCLGDTYPLCADRAPTHWVRQGATWILTGDASVEGPDMDREEGEFRDL